MPVEDAREDYDIEEQGDHEYVVRLQDQGETVEVLFRLSAAGLDRLGVSEDEEQDLVARSLDFLKRHQDVADLPDLVELEDLFAGYDDYEDAVTG